MPLVTVECPTGQLSPAQKNQLAEELTRVLLEIEGGGDTPFGRGGSLVRFREMPREDWYLGGTNDGTYVSASGMFLVDLTVPEGLLTQERISLAHKGTNDAFARVLGLSADDPVAMRCVWIQLTEWTEGHLAVAGRTTGLFGIAKRAGHPSTHPVLEYPRTYFAAKDRWYDANGFPASGAGRGLNRY